MIGKMPENILESFTETIPIEFTIIDEKDKVLAWNKHETRVFKRAPNRKRKNKILMQYFAHSKNKRREKVARLRR